ncbi:HTTM domain-containing protein [Streptomyces sp. B1866]|uniref:HTTM domain-containing protein n=1 Tax=Streptomyces sp. B1866 TaxID=3075431 RepID=UPI00288D18F0|nr:HTTM domain-containing protein [Streptomyces sp. B1866]MDT3397651.1 HTTM domain-containing protein [Streptomyces sp. B1866]
MTPPALTRLGARTESALGRGLARATGSALGPYQTAVVRVGFSFTWLVFLLREWPHRRELYGPDSPWSWEMAQRLIGGNHAFTALMWSRSETWFEIVYALAVLSSALLMLGWRTRTMSVLFMLGVLSLQNRSVFMGDGGDNIVHLMAIYLVLTRCGRVWSLDARRAEREAATAAEGREPPRDVTGVVLWAACGLALTWAGTFTDARLSLTADGPLPGVGWAAVLWGMWLGHAAWWFVRRYAPGEPRTVLDVIANLVHNGALLVIMGEVCLLYSSAGWYKIQGSRWQDGTALYYPMHLHYFTPWPALGDLLVASGTVVMVITYGTVIAQVAFPFTLLNRRVKNVMLVLMISEHLAIAILLGLPFFSLAMIAADAVFLPTSFLRRVGEWAGRVGARARPLLPAVPTPRRERPSGQESPARTLIG